MNRRLNVLLVNNEKKKYNNMVSVELVKYYPDINQVFVVKNYDELLQYLEKINIHILVLYLNMKCNKKIIQYLKDIKYTKRLHIIGVYRNDIELNCSYINDCDVLIKELDDFKVFCFQLINSYSNNKKKYTTIELISESEKQQEHSKQLYDTQQYISKALHDSHSISKYQKLVNKLFKNLIIHKQGISFEILNTSLLIVCMLDENTNLELIIYILTIEYNLDDIQIKRYLRIIIKDIFSIAENQSFLYSIFEGASEKVPPTKEFLITLRNYIV